MSTVLNSILDLASEGEGETIACSVAVNLKLARCD